MKAVVVAILMMLCLPAYGKILDLRTDPVTGPYRYGNSVDFNIDLGYGRTSNHDSIGMVSLRAGWLHISEPAMFSVGPSVQFFYNAPVSFGAQAEAKNLWMGVWGQLGLYTNTHKQFIVAPGAGFSFVGAELQTFGENGKMQWRMIGKLKIDVGLIALGIMGE